MINNNEKTYTLNDLELANYLIVALNNAGIYTISDLLRAIKNNRISFVHGLGKKKISQLKERLLELGYDIEHITRSNKVLQLLDDIGSVYEIPNYTKNYLIYKYDLKICDVQDLLYITKKYKIKFRINDIIDKGLDQRLAHFLYNHNIITTNDLYQAYNFGTLQNIRGLGKKKLKVITEYLNTVNL